MAQNVSLVQPSFAAGELAPALQGRVDLGKYRVGAALMRNFFTMPYGGAATRAGTVAIGRTKQTVGTPPRFIPFIFSTLQAYILEFGQQYMRVIMNGGYVLEPALSIVGVTQANPGVFNIVAHGWSPGDQIFVTGALGMTQINSTTGYQYVVASVPDANHVTFTDLDGNYIDTAAWPAYTSGGTAARVYTLTTTYQATDLPLLKFTQSADVMTLTHPSYAPRDLTRTQHWAWTLNIITFAALVQKPTGLAATPSGSSATLDFYYIVTSLTDSPNEESVASSSATCTNAALDQTAGVNNSLAWTAPATGPTPNRYRIYKALPVKHGLATPTVFGYIGTSTSTTFVDANIGPDFSQQPPTHQNPFASSVFPSCVNYYQARKVFGGPYAYPEAIYATQSGNFANMDTHSPTQDNDAITISLSSQQVNAVKHLVSMNALIALTSSGAWQISGGANTVALTPSQVQAQAQAYNGSADVPPLAINYDILYVQARGSKVRDLAYNFYVNLFTGNDLSILSSHLFYGYTLLEWCYAEEPFYQINAVRNDGEMLAFTYLKEQDVYAWSHYDSPGNSGTDAFVSVASIPATTENVIYTVVKRTIPGINNGQPVYMAEMFASRNFYVNGLPDVRYAWCVDCGAQYIGAATSTITGLQHLEGATVAVLADGGVQASKIVKNGSITLDNAASIVTVGLPYVCQLQTLRIDRGEPTPLGKRKKISRCSLLVENTRGLAIGPMRETTDGTLVVGPLTHFKERSNQAWGTPVALKTGLESMLISPQWQVDGAVFIEQDKPLPATVLAVIPDVVMGDDAG